MEKARRGELRLINRGRRDPAFREDRPRPRSCGALPGRLAGLNAASLGRFPKPPLAGPQLTCPRAANGQTRC